MPFYMLIKVLFDEAELVPRDINLIREEQLEERNHTTYATVNQILFSLWDEFNGGELPPSKLLKKCAKLYCKNSV